MNALGLTRPWGCGPGVRRSASRVLVMVMMIGVVGGRPIFRGGGVGGGFFIVVGFVMVVGVGDAALRGAQGGRRGGRRWRRRCAVYR